MTKEPLPHLIFILWVWFYFHKYDNLKDGYGIFEWPNGKKYRGQWAKGKQNAEGEIYER